MKPRIAPQTIVERDGHFGVTCPDLHPPMDVCSPEQTPVVWEHGEVDLGMRGELTDTLRVVGPERAIPVLECCGAGRGADCCIFLTAGPTGLSCERFGGLRWRLLFQKSSMSAQREPLAFYPHCFLPRVLESPVVPIQATDLNETGIEEEDPPESYRPKPPPAFEGGGTSGGAGASGGWEDPAPAESSSPDADASEPSSPDASSSSESA